MSPVQQWPGQLYSACGVPVGGTSANSSFHGSDTTYMAMRQSGARRYHGGNRRAGRRGAGTVAATLWCEWPFACPFAAPLPAAWPFAGGCIEWRAVSAAAGAPLVAACSVSSLVSSCAASFRARFTFHGGRSASAICSSHVLVLTSSEMFALLVMRLSISDCEREQSAHLYS